MTLKEAQVELGNAVYKAALLIEKWELEGLVTGNGHHAAQKIAQFARDDLASRWVDTIKAVSNADSRTDCADS